jgi:two-component system sensor histidine kinase DevS
MVTPAMFRLRPPQLAWACIILWVVHVGLHMRGHVGHWRTGDTVGLVIDAFLLSTSVVLRRALRWKPRRSVRLSAESRAEQQRIAHDLHDSLGTQLLLTKLWAENHHPEDRQLLEHLEKCKLDMRLVVDSMSMVEDSLTDRLARLRHRLQPLLEQRGMCMLWQVEPEGGVPLPQGGRVQGIFSIVQQALVNALQHAQATQVLVSMQYEPQTAMWRFVVADDGVGAPLPLQQLFNAPAAATPVGGAAAHGGSAPVGGLGTASMRAHARAVGGTLRWEGAPGGGTRVCLDVPCA